MVVRRLPRKHTFSWRVGMCFKNILDELDEIIYVADIETYDVLFLNKAAANLLLRKNGEERKCYAVIHGKTAPCEFCNNAELSETFFFYWEYTNEKCRRHFMVKDKLIPWNGRKACLGVAVDITEKEEEKNRIRSELKASATVVDCLRALDQEEEPSRAAAKVLRLVGAFYAADRVFFWAAGYAGSGGGQEGDEWRAPGVAAHPVPVRDRAHCYMQRWNAEFAQAGGAIVNVPVPSDGDGPAFAPLMLVPMFQGVHVTGCLGAENPRCSADASLLQSVAYFMKNYLEKQESKRHLEWLGFTDPLTRLGNRNGYIARLREMKRSAAKDFGVVYVDINGLKALNYKFGHDYGDRVIVKVADILRGIFLDDVFRTGDDEYVAVCSGMSKHAFDGRVEAMRRAFADTGECNVSCGAAWKSRVEDVDALIRHADELMAIEKQSYYKDNLGRRPLHRSSVLEETLRSLERREFLIHLQPKVCLKTGAPGGAEALVRRRDRDGAFISPAMFIPLLESALLVRHVDFFVLHEVCGLLRQWMGRGAALFPVSVNLSRITLMEHGIVEKIASVCRMYGVPHRLIDIEITESVGNMDMGCLRSVADDLLECGFTLSLDDFGAKYCNLALLTDIKFNFLKIDKEIIGNLADNNRSRLIIKHCIEVCAEMDDVHCIAEGVENQQQLDILRTYRCDYGQGFYFSRPLAVTAFERAYIDAPPGGAAAS